MFTHIIIFDCRFIFLEVDVPHIMKVLVYPVYFIIHISSSI